MNGGRGPPAGFDARSERSFRAAWEARKRIGARVLEAEAEDERSTRLAPAARDRSGYRAETGGVAWVRGI